MVTLKDVAQAAGVHITTASSVLNKTSGNSRFSAETRQRVVAAARQLGYSQNRAARSLRTRRSGTVGLVAGNIQNPFFAALSLQLEKQLRDAGYDLVLTCHGADSARDETELAQMLLGRSVDGLLVWSEQRGGRSPRLPKSSPIPRVWLGHGPRGECAVRIDIARGVALALEHLRSIGCRRIAYYAPSYSRDAGLPRSRPEIIESVAREMGIPQPRFFYFDDESWNLSAAVERARPLVGTARAGKIDGVLGFNDVSAVGWDIAARAAGFDVPVVGFDGSPLIKAWLPSPSYVDLRIGEVAARAVSMIGGLIAGERPDNPATDIHPIFVAGRTGD